MTGSTVTKILIAPDSFKGSISAIDAAKEIAIGWQSVRPDDELIIIPLADGGEGTLEAISYIRGGTFIDKTVMGPDGRSVNAQWLLLDDGTAFVELARASGLPLMQALNPLGAHTFGFGELLKDAAQHPLTQRIIATVGGSASTDGGSGALTALGYGLYDIDDQPIELGGDGLRKLKKIDSSKAIKIPSGGLVVLTDVTNPLLGKKGAAQIFAPQKGASSADIEILENGLRNFADMAHGEIDIPGSGAAGGTAFGLATLCGAQIQSGSQYLFALLNLSKETRAADLLITGEGSLDSQSWDGKVIGELVELATAHSCRIWAIVGADKSDMRKVALEEVISLSDLAGGSNTAINNVHHWLQIAAKEAALRFVRK